MRGAGGGHESGMEKKEGRGEKKEMRKNTETEMEKLTKMSKKMVREAER